jgi:hypothetical protein
LASEYEAKAGEMTSAEFELAVARMVALADNGHSDFLPVAFDVVTTSRNRSIGG